MLAAARKHNINLFCFPGGSLNPVGEFNLERSAIFNLVDVERFEGLVTLGATAPGGLDPERAAAAFPCPLRLFPPSTRLLFVTVRSLVKPT